MPIGIIINALCIFLGGFIGLFARNFISERIITNLNMIFGLCSMGMGISSIVLMENMPAVIFALILGTGIGLAIHLGDKIRAGALMMEKASSRIVKSSPSALDRKEFTETLITIIVIFVASGTGIYGSIVSGMTGDHSIMIAKSILDLFTAIIFSCTLGSVVSLIAIPQFILFMTLFLLAGVIYPLTTPAMINDFKAVGGFFMLAAGFRMNKVTKLSNSGYDSCYDPDHAFQLDLEQLYPSVGVLSQQNATEYDCSGAPEFDTINPYGTLHAISYKFINEWIRGI